MVTIDGFLIDATVTQEHSDRSVVTEHPVERGANVVDHVLELPAMLTIEGIVSDTPIQPAAAQREDGSVPSDDAYAKLLEIGRKPITVVTATRTYENMVRTELSRPIDARTGKALRFRATFTQIELVENRLTTVSLPVAKDKTNRGPKAKKPAPEQSPTPPSTVYNGGVILFRKAEQQGGRIKKEAERALASGGAH